MDDCTASVSTPFAKTSVSKLKTLSSLTKDRILQLKFKSSGDLSVTGPDANVVVWYACLVFDGRSVVDMHSQSSIKDLYLGQATSISVGLIETTQLLSARSSFINSHTSVHSYEQRLSLCRCLPRTPRHLATPASPHPPDLRSENETTHGQRNQVNSNHTNSNTQERTRVLVEKDETSPCNAMHAQASTVSGMQVPRWA